MKVRFGPIAEVRRTKLNGRFVPLNSQTEFSAIPLFKKILCLTADEME